MFHGRFIENQFSARWSSLLKFKTILRSLGISTGTRQLKDFPGILPCWSHPVSSSRRRSCSQECTALKKALCTSQTHGSTTDTHSSGTLSVSIGLCWRKKHPVRNINYFWSFFIRSTSEISNVSLFFSTSYVKFIEKYGFEKKSITIQITIQYKPVLKDIFLCFGQNHFKESKK